MPLSNVPLPPLGPLWILEDTVRSIHTLLQAEQPPLSQPPFIGDCSSPVIIFMASSGLVLIGVFPFCIECSRAGCSTAGEASSEQSRGAELAASPCWQCCFDCSHSVFVSLGCEYTLLGHVELLVHPQFFSSGLLTIHSPPSLYLCLGLP